MCLLGTAYKIAAHSCVRRVDDGRADQYTSFCHPQGVVRYYQSENSPQQLMEAAYETPRQRTRRRRTLKHQNIRSQPNPNRRRVDSGRADQ